MDPSPIPHHCIRSFPSPFSLTPRLNPITAPRLWTSLKCHVDHGQGEGNSMNKSTSRSSIGLGWDREANNSFLQPQPTVFRQLPKGLQPLCQTHLAFGSGMGEGPLPSHLLNVPWCYCQGWAQTLPRPTRDTVGCVPDSKSSLCQRSGSRQPRTCAWEAGRPNCA